MKKLLTILLLLLPFTISSTAYAKGVDIPVEVESPMDVSLLYEGEIKETKKIEKEDTFNVDIKEIGKYVYKLKSGYGDTINVDIYVTNDGDTVLIYEGDNKLTKAYFKMPPTEPTKETSIEPTEETSESTENITTQESYNPPSQTDGNINTGERNYIPVFIIVACAAGAVILTTLIIYKKKSRKGGGC